VTKGWENMAALGRFCCETHFGTSPASNPEFSSAFSAVIIGKLMFYFGEFPIPDVIFRPLTNPENFKRCMSGYKLVIL